MTFAVAKLDPAATRRLREFPHETPLMSCVVDPTGRWCFAGGRSRRVYVTDLDSGVTESLEDHESWVVTVEQPGRGREITISQVDPASASTTTRLIGARDRSTRTRVILHRRVAGHHR